MDDEKIIELYWQRNEDAIAETASKYGKLCRFICGNVLSRPEDCEEVVNDTYLAAWNAIPRQRPGRFAVFISRIARNLALKRYDYNAAAKRNPEAVCSLEELAECVSGRANVENEAYDGIPYRVARYEDTGLASHRRYYYRVRSVKTDGTKGALSEEFGAVTRGK